MQFNNLAEITNFCQRVPLVVQKTRTWKEKICELSK